jgi:hypothetical protein
MPGLLASDQYDDLTGAVQQVSLIMISMPPCSDAGDCAVGPASSSVNQPAGVHRR